MCIAIIQSRVRLSVCLSVCLTVFSSRRSIPHGNVDSGTQRGGDVTATCDVSVHVTDVNDNSPRWAELATPTFASVPETLMSAGARRTEVASLTATDLDEDDLVTYSLDTGQTAISIVY